MGTDADGRYWDGNPSYHRLLRYTNPMMKGEDVRWAQRALIKIGYYSGVCLSIPDDSENSENELID